MLLLLQKYLRRAAFQLFPLANLQTTSSFLLFLSELESLLKLYSLAAFWGFCFGNTQLLSTPKKSSCFILLWSLGETEFPNCRPDRGVTARNAVGSIFAHDCRPTPVHLLISAEMVHRLSGEIQTSKDFFFF